MINGILRKQLFGSAGAILAAVCNLSMAADLSTPNIFVNGSVANANEVNANFTEVEAVVNSKQDKLTGSVCPAGQVVQSIAADGTTTCVTDAVGVGGGGDISAVLPGTGLTGGGDTGDVTLSVDPAVLADVAARQNQLTGSVCAPGQVVQSIATDGTTTCIADADSGGDITAVLPGTGLAGGGGTGDVTLSVDNTVVQSRVSGGCLVGEAIRVINDDGTVVCEVDDAGVGGDAHSLDAVDGNPVDALFVDVIGNVGIGTTVPNSPLTVSNPLPLFESENTSLGASWRFGTDSAGDFIINKTSGTTFSPLTVNDNGQVFITRDSGQVIPEPPCTSLTINNVLPGLSGCIEGMMIADGLGGALWIGHDVNANQSVTLAWLGFSQYARLDSRGGPLVLQDQSGENVGIGTTTPVSKLEVIGTVTASAFASVSDARLKHDIRAIDAPLDKIGRLRGVSYRWNRDAARGAGGEAGTRIGLVAQEVAEVVPEAARRGSDGTWSVNYDAIIPLLVEAVKEQQRMISDLHKQLATLREGAPARTRLLLSESASTDE